MSSSALQNNQPDPFDPFALRVHTQTPPQPTLSAPQKLTIPVSSSSPNPLSHSPLGMSGLTRPSSMSISPNALMSQFAVTPQPKPLSPYTRLSLSSASSSPKSSPFSAFNPYFIPPISPSNHCKSPSLIARHDADWTYCLSPSQKLDSPRMGAKEANEVWEAQWSPFHGAARGAAAGSAAKPKSPGGSKFSWQWEENGHERDKGDDSTSEEDEDEESKEERKEQSTDAARGQQKKSTTFAFDSLQADFAPPAATTAPSHSAKYAIPAISPRTFKSTLTPKRRSATPPTASAHSVASAPAPATTTFSLFPVAATHAGAHPGSPPPPSPVLAARPAAAAPAVDPVSSTKAPPAMATAAAATVQAAGPTPSPEALAAAALLKANTIHNKTLAATPEELFADLDTPANGGRARRVKAKSVVFCDEAVNPAVQRVLAQVHLVPDDYTQYPIPDKKKKGKGKGKEKCRVM